jgi:hypothetical protein
MLSGWRTAIVALLKASSTSASLTRDSKGWKTKSMASSAAGFVWPGAISISPHSMDRIEAMMRHF